MHLSVVLICLLQVNDSITITTSIVNMTQTGAILESHLLHISFIFDLLDTVSNTADQQQEDR